MSAVKLKLDLDSFDESRYCSQITKVEKITSIQSMLELGDNEINRKRLYELNKLCSADIPERGKFYTYDEFCKARYGSSYDPAQAMIATMGPDWIGLSVNSNWSKKGFLFTEMTGVVQEHRKKSIALVMKIYGIRAARKTGAKGIYTITADVNPNSVRMNLRLGFVRTEWESLI
jgi:hypothetical protein